MITSILDYLLPHKEKSDKEIQNLLHQANVWIFDDIFNKFQIESEAKEIILYILFAYSKESPMLILMADYQKEKEGICRYLDIPDYLTNKLTTLDDSTIREAVNNFIEDYAPQQWKTLQFLKIQMADLNRMVTLKQTCAPQEEETEQDGKKEKKVIYVFDPKAHRDTIRLISELGKMIAQIEGQIKNSFNYANIAKNEIKEAKSRKGQRSAGVENSNYIIRNDGKIAAQ